MAAFETNTYSNGGTALAAFEVNPLPIEAGRLWRHLTLNTYTYILVAGRRWRHLRLRSTLVAGRHWPRLR